MPLVGLHPGVLRVFRRLRPRRLLRLLEERLLLEPVVAVLLPLLPVLQPVPVLQPEKMERLVAQPVVKLAMLHKPVRVLLFRETDLPLLKPIQSVEPMQLRGLQVVGQSLVPLVLPPVELRLPNLTLTVSWRQ